jgi:beta-N-acetylhexosaminidase
MGVMPQRVAAALSAGCDMALICNRRDAVVQTLGELKLQPDPTSLARIAGIRGIARMDESVLFASTQWQTVNALMQSTLQL